MARERAKKSAHKGKRKKNGPSSSPIMKTKSVDEVTTIQALKVPSTIPEKPHFDEDDFNDVTEVIPPASLEDYIHQSMEKAILSD